AATQEDIVCQSMMLGSFRSRARRGLGFGGASSAARKAVQRSASSWNTGCSFSVRAFSIAMRSRCFPGDLLCTNARLYLLRFAEYELEDFRPKLRVVLCRFQNGIELLGEQTLIGQGVHAE